MKEMRQFLDTLVSRARAFLPEKRGNVAMMFALTLVPLTIAAGAGLDYWRAVLVRQQMAEALDAAALAVGSTPGLDSAHATTLAQTYFNANYKVPTGAYGTPVIQPITYNSQGSVTVTATDVMPTTVMAAAGAVYAEFFGGAAGWKTMNVNASSTVVWGQSKLWVALVLDNSGSMSQGDSSGSKMTALKNASNQLLTTLQNASSTPGDVQVAIVPFASLVKPNLSGTTYIDFREFDAQPPLGSGYMTPTATINGLSFTAWGPKDNCPFTGTDGYVCTATATNNTNCSSDNSSGCTATIPTTGLICPSMHGYSSWQDGSADRLYNGCYSSTKISGTTVTVASGSSATCNGFSSTNCTCSGSGSSKKCKTQAWTHVWVTNAHSTWTGCVMDRQQKGFTTYGATAATQDYDVTNTAPGSGDSLFPALNSPSCLSATVTPLEYNWTDLTSQINAMQPGGATNQALGMEHGWQALTPGTPYGAPAVPANTARYIIILSDGLNTQDRWYGNGRVESTTADGNIDTRMNTVCSNAKADGVIVYSIYVNIGGTDGNSTPLQNCASDSSKYFALTTTSAVVTTFNQIAQQITNVRVSQ